jgi:uncharacterized membrane protein
MKTQTFSSEIRDDAIVRAIQDLELKTSGELRVLITGQAIDDPLQAAWQAFARLGMDRTALRNSVLIFVAPEAQKFALIHDQGYAEQSHPAFWQTLAEDLSQGFKSGDYTGTLARVIAQAGTHMAQIFPRHPGDGDANELPDTPIRE